MKSFGLLLFAPFTSAFVLGNPGSSLKGSSATKLRFEASEMKGYYTIEYPEEQLKTLIPAETGFDPFGFTKTKAGFFFMREAEIKHARLAMLAAAGWYVLVRMFALLALISHNRSSKNYRPVAELFDRPLARFLDSDVVVDSASRTPSVLNGGLDKVSPFFWAFVLLAASAIDIYQINTANEGKEDYFPGNLGWDPMRIYPKEKESQLSMQLKEIKNGRLAMIAITAFAFQEYGSDAGVVVESPLFFKPFF